MLTEEQKAQGVTEADIGLWSLLSDADKQKIKEEHHQDNLTMILYLNKDKGYSPEVAFQKMYTTNIQYSDYPLAPEYVNELKSNGYTELDFPLPWELFPRIHHFYMRLESDPELYSIMKEGKDEGLSSNAILRHLLEAGELEFPK